MTRCKIPKFSEGYKIDIEIYDDKGKEILPRSVKKRDIFVYIHRNLYCVIQKKTRKDTLLIGVEEMNRNFKYVKTRLNENNIKQRFPDRLHKPEIIDQLENVFVFDLETYNDQEFVDAYATGLYDVNRL